MAHLVAILLILLPAALAQMCNQSFPTYAKFARVFVASYKGPTLALADGPMMLHNLGGCRTLDEHAKKMIEYFESWGVDMSSRRGKVYEVINDDDVTISPFVGHPDASFLITTGSLFDHAKVMNAPLTLARWLLIPKANITGPRGFLPDGYHIEYGMFRFVNDGQEVCIEFSRDTPIPPITPESYEVSTNYELNHNEWKNGLARGVGRISRHNRNIKEVDFVMIFPGDTL